MKPVGARNVGVASRYLHVIGERRIDGTDVYREGWIGDIHDLKPRRRVRYVGVTPRHRHIPGVARRFETTGRGRIKLHASVKEQLVELQRSQVED